MGYDELELFARQMEAAGLHQAVIDAFGRLYTRYRDGDPGQLPWSGVSPAGPRDLLPFDAIGPADRERGRQLLSQLVVVSLNGGLGTTMKLDHTKSLIPVRDGMTFLSLTAQQILKLRASAGCRVPWLLMNSYHTRDETLDALSAFPELRVQDLPLDFVQNRFPRIVARTGLPLDLDDSEANWAPPGHGDLYLAMWLTGLLERLLQLGYRWVSVSNIDNLGSTVDPGFLGLMEREGLQFVMEVARRTLADIKGGPLIRYTDPDGRGRLMLLERTQVEREHLSDFGDLQRFDAFNTNTLWWRLEVMLDRLRQGTLELPMIVNPKTVQGVEVVQLETAMGAAVGSFERAAGVRVPRSRFAPVKATADLLVVRSDAYRLDSEDHAIRPSPDRPRELVGPPVVRLDDRYYKGLPDLDARIPDPPSLVACRSLTIEGDVRLGAGVRMEGDVVLRNPATEQKTVPDGTVLRDETREL